MTGGHGAWIGREADGPDDVRKAVREQLKACADIVKFIATGGVMTPNVGPGAQQLTLEELQAGVEEAHKAGFKTAAHAHGAEGIQAAVLAGIDSDKLADLVLWRSDIVANIGRLRSPDTIRAVIQGGRIVHKSGT